MLTKRAISKTKTQTSHEHVSIKEQISKGDFDTDFETRGIMCHEHVSIKEQRAISKRGIMCDILKLKLNVQYLIFNLSSNKPTPYKKKKKLAKSNTGKYPFRSLRFVVNKSFNNFLKASLYRKWDLKRSHFSMKTCACVKPLSLHIYKNHHSRIS